MTPLPPPLGGGEFVAWRLDQARHAESWGSGEGAFRVGGRWNRRGQRAIYCALDPATAILEVAVHTGFVALNTVPHVLTSLTLIDPVAVHVVHPNDVPNPHWLRPGTPSAGQQAFGSALIDRHGCVIFPSVISGRSWNLVLKGMAGTVVSRLRTQEKFVLDTRLHSPA